MSQRQYAFQRESAAAGGTPRLAYVSRAQYSSDWNSSLHTHGCAELFFITGGHGRFRTRREEFPVAIHDAVIVNASVPHTEVSQLDSPLEYTVLGVEGLETMAGAEGYALLHLHTGWEELMGCLRLMLREAEEALPGYERVCRSLLDVVLVRLNRQRDAALSGEPSDARSSRECDLVRRYIDNHFKENLSLDQLAQLAHLNKYYLAHAFRREFGVSPINYLISRRIEESRFLLRETDHTLSLIAQILGFSSLSYFSQCFRRVEGVSPLEYRKARR
ncbi:MAG: AraC family transcriptional regulator [Oscillibacter sp.]|nr:AraC family transcriptional regulator [uncultured Oscillibacter sp.]MCI8971001.1 AraC family transcriptional regulator [Oscillibacter sp.]